MRPDRTRGNVKPRLKVIFDARGYGGRLNEPLAAVVDEWLRSTDSLLVRQEIAKAIVNRSPTPISHDQIIFKVDPRPPKPSPLLPPRSPEDNEAAKLAATRREEAHAHAEAEAEQLKTFKALAKWRESLKSKENEDE